MLYERDDGDLRISTVTNESEAAAPRDGAFFAVGSHCTGPGLTTRLGPGPGLLDFEGVCRASALTGEPCVMGWAKTLGRDL